ncbi:UNVERIFIED_CONTAM: hypothetical protein RMT77_005872 [Armadillidium vulgare]
MVSNMTLFPSNITCSAANGSPIKCFGEIVACITIPKLRREFNWTFIVAEVAMPMLGMDFLHHYNLLIDCGNKTLRDNHTTLLASLKSSFMEVPSVQAQLQIENPVITSLLQEYSSLTSPIDLNSLTCKTDGPCHYIETGDSPPVFARARRLPDDKLKAAKAEFDILLKSGIIRPSKSSWASPLHLVPKKTPGTWRPCGDFRALNNITKQDRYPIPNIQSLSQRLHHSTIFSKIDLQRAYHQIPIRPDDVEKTAVITPFGLFEFLSMPFGLKNAGATFQRVMDSIFRDLPFVFTYLDDCLIFSNSKEEHETHLKQVFQLLQENSFKISLEKCEFFRTSLTFLGYKVSSEGLTPPSEKKEAITAFPLPPDSAALRKFLGMIGYYRRFIPNFAKIIFPLSEKAKLHPKDKQLSWTEEEIATFQEIKEALQNATTLPFSLPNVTHLQLVTDSSQTSIGAALHQMIDGQPVPVDFYSKKLSEPQRKYSAFDRELLAAYYSVLHFKHILEGRTVTLCTDHKPLVSAFYSKNPAKSDRQQRHLSVLNEYITSMHYIRGEDNIVADTFSRISSVTVDAVDLPALAQLQETDEEIKQYHTRLRSYPLQDNLKIWCETSTSHPRPFLPKSSRLQICNNLHQMSHPGVKGSLRLIKTRYFWPCMDRDVRLFVRTCEQCQTSKVHRYTKQPITPVEIPSSRFETVHIDIVGPFSPSATCGSSSPVFRYLLTCIDRNTKWTEAFPITNTTAKSVAYAFMQWISRFGVPLYVISDRGPQFESEFFTELSHMIGFHRLRTSAYHPQANSQIERFHRSLKTALMARKENWLLSLPIILLSLRCIPNDSGYSAFEAVTGKTPLCPMEILQSTPNNKQSLDSFMKKFMAHMKELDFRELPTFHPSQNSSYMPKELQTCTHVFLRTDRIRKSLEAPYSGPYEVLQRMNRCFKIKLRDGRTDVVSIGRLKPAIMKTPTKLPSDVTDVPTSDVPDVPTSDAPDVPTSDAPDVPTSDAPDVPTSDAPDVPFPYVPDVSTPDVTDGLVPRRNPLRRVRFREDVHSVSRWGTDI